ncbi:atypical chemokine receptor 3-like [Hydractinia symbiolongicarpus]|uniref:atypical chemokine receptor 3-like n=1 Tax=Hydractinia symbiolongicarpus TaxID=13093 RepID=UPI00255073E1|nr:atypical chemokine receptor 3-like [Hydractinia symbiolongicarpus]
MDTLIFKLNMQFLIIIFNTIVVFAANSSNMTRSYNTSISTIHESHIAESSQVECKSPNKNATISSGHEKTPRYGNSVAAFLKKYCQMCNITDAVCNCNSLSDICTLLNTRVEHMFLYQRWRYLTIGFFNVFFGVCGIIGNVIVLLVTYFERVTISRCQYLITCLAGVDLLFSILQVILYMPYFWTFYWIYGEPMCKILHGASDLSFMLALGFISVIALERFFGIVYTLNGWFSKGFLKLAVILNFITAFIVTLYAALRTKLETISDKNERCQLDFSRHSHRIFNWFINVLYFALPVFIISVLYYFIAKKLNSKQETEVTSMLEEKQRVKRLKNNKRIMKILFAIVVALVILVLPNRIVATFFVYANDITVKTEDIIIIIGYVPYSLHVAINPILYSLIDSKFKKKCKRIFQNSVTRLTVYLSSQSANDQDEINDGRTTLKEDNF